MARGQAAFEAMPIPGRLTNRHQRGQSSLEAMLAFAALLCALAVLAHAARAQSDAFAASVEKADARVALAHEALYIDLAADLLPGAALSRNLSGVPVSGGRWLASGSSGAIREPLLHSITVSGEGKYYANAEN